ncbi:transmembrane protein [Spiroplasma sabaudiense Ar-1343]|uniref:Transmembrane protein n=1 Tax=Spiroplasma sabaudiense Ar-1343 TaxID=1276257 RepID=W6A9J1_9MOLU|nr:hypothetical protein [Spiroplasma sabaudiense]AHI53651.1 transmembrane protein [Spiroplasma sabaudiense Ar-1343]
MSSVYHVNLVLIITVISTLVALFSIRFYFSNYYNNLKVPIIKSADINIASSKINQIIKEFLFYNKCSELQVIYENQANYIKTFSGLDRKKKIIYLPKIQFNSVGYELDYILGRIWVACRLYKNNNNIKYYRSITTTFPLFFKIIYYSSVVATISFFIFWQLAPISIKENDFLIFLQNYPVLPSTSLAAFLGIIILFLISQKSKSNLEDFYEMEMTEFIKDNLIGYKEDYLAARVYSRSIPYLLTPIFRTWKQVENQKFLGPFNII